MEIHAAAASGSPQQAAPTPSGTATAQLPDAKGSTEDDRQPLAATVAKLFGSPDAPQSVSVQVSYRVEGGDIVTVFTDPKSGKEIAQFPSEVMIQIAQFFDKETGVAVDRSA
jgi:uncharacterized FlaG/YvyC family protein